MGSTLRASARLALLVERAKPREKRNKDRYGDEHQRKNSADSPPVRREGLSAAQHHKAAGADAQEVETESYQEQDENAYG